MNAGVLFMLMQGQAAYPEVLGVLFVSAIAGVLSHVPAGLGVLEAVFVALLSHQLPRSELLASLLMYRAFYYLAPLALATLTYLAVETGQRRRDAASIDGASPARKREKT
jgi:uncharacterized membrane protein YbhN (UPF0104 family)